jgi:iron complex outermembrane receptor protein
MELSGQQLWGRHLRTDVSLTAMKAVYDQAFGAVLANNRLPAIPDRLGFVALSWSQAGWGGTKPPIGWQGSVEWLGRSRLYANETNTLAAGGYVTTQLRLRYRQPIGESGAIEPFLAIDNLTQKTAVASVIVNQSAPFEPALPRTWTLGLQAKWAL